MSGAAAPPPSVAALERASHSAVPAARVAFDGPFVVRAFLGGTGRANAASSLDPAPDPELPVRVERIVGRYARLGLPARFRSTPLDPPGLDALLRERGFAGRDETCVLAGPLDAFAADDEVEALDGPTEAWLSVVATAGYQTEARREEKTRSPAMLVPPAAWMLLRARGVPAAGVFVVADGPLAGFFDLAVRPEFQRQGLARRAMAAAASWARARGAAWAWGQVAATNAPSLALNRGLGLREAYRYRYFIRGA
jgi:GNAT superfamily N-acetyltransferase